MVETSCLENSQVVKGLVSSNLTASAETENGPRVVFCFLLICLIFFPLPIRNMIDIDDVEDANGVDDK